MKKKNYFEKIIEEIDLDDLSPREAHDLLCKFSEKLKEKNRS